MAGTSAPSSFTVKLNGIPLTCVSAPDSQPSKEGEGAAYAGGWEPWSRETPYVRGTVPIYLRKFPRGAGYVQMRDEDDDGGYAWAEDAFTHFDSGVTPSGRRTAVTGHLGLGTISDPITSVIFNGHLWCPLASTGRMIRYANANPAAVPVHDPALNSFGSATESFRAGYIPTSIAVFATAAGVPALYVSCYNAGLGATRLYQYTVAGGWTESAVLGFGISSTKLATSWWEDKTGVGAERLHFQTAASELRHCIYGTDPMLAASYVTPLTVGNAAYSITALAAAPQRLFVVKQDGIHDFNELRSWNMTPYWRERPLTTVFRRPAMLYDEHVMAAREPFGLDRYDVRLDGQQQRIPGECAPGFGWQDGTPITGRITAMCEGDGWLFVAVMNPNNGKSYILRGKAREILDVRSKNPIVWFGAEQVLPTVGGGIPQVLHMRAGPPVSATTLGDGPAYLWMFASLDNYSLGSNVDTVLYYAPLPYGSGPLSLQASGGTFPYNSPARLYFTHQNWGDRNAGKGIPRIDVVGRQVSATSTIQIKAHTDATPTQITTEASWGDQGTATANATRLVTTSLAGQSVALEAILTTPSPFTVPPILEEVSPRAHIVRESIEWRKLWIVLERDYPLRNGAPDIRKPDTTLASVVARQQVATTSTFVDEAGTSYTVYVNQGIEYGRVDVGNGDWRTTAGIEVQIVG